MAARKSQFTVYLAGPVRGCNDVQKRKWRKAVKEKADFRCLDPLDDPVDESAPPHQLIDKDIKSIESADAVLAYMWRESIGTAIGLVHARAKGRIIVIVDPNHLDNPFLDFYADIVVTTLNEGIQAMRDLLRASTLTVLKRGQRGTQPFNREKLIESVRAAAREAHRNDITVPALVLRRVTDALASSTRKVGKTITTTEIEKLVVDALESLEADPAHLNACAGVLDAWKKREGLVKALRRKAAATPMVGAGADGAATGRVQFHVHGSKAHTSIWARHISRLEDVPSPARDVLQGLANAGGVTEIKLNTMGPGAKRLKVGIHLDDWKGGLVSGYIVDPAGEKGRKQSFQLRVLRAGTESSAVEAMKKWLEQQGAWIEG